jgi:hypothetical protein
MKNVLKGIILFGIIIVITQGCVTQKRCLQKFPPAVTRDSVYVEVSRDVPVYLPGDSILVEVPINCPDQNLADVEFTKLRQQLLILHGKLISKTKIKPDTIFITVHDTQTVVREVKVPQPVKFVPNIYKYALWGWVLIIIAVAVLIVWKIYKPKIFNLFK